MPDDGKSEVFSLADFESKSSVYCNGKGKRRVNNTKYAILTSYLLHRSFCI